MHEERLKHMKETLMCAVEMQLCDLGDVDTEELGQAIDMIKDLEEAIYYCTVTEAMKGNDTEMEFEMKKGGHNPEHGNGDNRMYYYNGNRSYMPYNDSGMIYADDGRRRRADGTFYAEGQGRNYAGGGQGGSSGGSQGSSSGGGTSYADSGSGTSYNATNGGSMYAENMPYMDGQMYRDEREGRSYNSRRMYMEAKDMKRDKATQLRELEKYMQELSQDITEMIADASPEEKQYLEKKITALASKIGQMK